MPSPTPSSKRERLARFISRFWSKRTSGSTLVVQTGFPTSLADLIVKNRAKFKKRRKPSHYPEFDSAASVEVRSESERSRDRQALVTENPDQIDEQIQSASDLSPAPKRRRGVGLWLGFLMVKTVTLVVLAVGRKWVVAGITVLTFGLLVLEDRGLLRPRSSERNAIDRGLVSPSREVEDHQNSECLDSRSCTLLERRDFDAVVNDNRDRDLFRPRSIERNNIQTYIGGFDLRGRELVSPIREVDSENHQIERISDIFAHSKGNYAAENIIMNQDSTNSHKSKRKKLFGKLFKRKNH